MRMPLKKGSLASSCNVIFASWCIHGGNVVDDSERLRVPLLLSIVEEEIEDSDEGDCV